MCSTTVSFFSIVLWDTWMQDPLAIRARWCGDPSGWQPLKLGCYMCGPNPLLLREELGVGVSHFIVRQCAWGGRYRESVSLPFLLASMWVFSQLFNVEESVKYSFWIFLRGNCSTYSSVFCAFTGGGKFRRLLCHYLGDNHSSFPFV